MCKTKIYKNPCRSGCMFAFLQRNGRLECLWPLGVPFTLAGKWEGGWNIRTHLTQSLWQEAMVTAIFARAARDCEGSNVFRSLVMACGFFDTGVSVRPDEVDPALVAMNPTPAPM